MSDELPEAPDMEVIEVEVTIKDDIYTLEEYTTRLLMTQRELETRGPQEMVEMATAQVLDGALRQYLSHQRGVDSDE